MNRERSKSARNHTPYSLGLATNFKKSHIVHTTENPLNAAPFWTDPNSLCQFSLTPILYGLLVYDQEAKTIVELGEGFSTEVPDFSAKLFLLYPKTKGWAIIGRSDKYLPAAAVKVQAVTDSEITFTLQESGPLTVWSANGAPQMDSATFESIGDNLYLANLPVSSGEMKLTLRR